MTTISTSTTNISIDYRSTDKTSCLPHLPPWNMRGVRSTNMFSRKMNLLLMLNGTTKIAVFQMV